MTTDESKPPMRQIAELIDAIATARAESAERLLGECETQLIETRAHLGDMVGQLAHCYAEIAKLRAELAEALADRADLLAENATLADKLADLSATPINATAPAADPRVDALCRFAMIILQGHNLGPTLWDSVGDPTTGIILNGDRR